MNRQERNRQSLETIFSDNKFIKSEYDEEILISVGEFGQGGDITVRKEDGKWYGSDGKTFMGYLTPDEIVEWYDKDYGSAWLCNSRKPIKSSIGTLHCVYLSDITPTEWTKDMALAAIKNSVTNYGYYEYNGKKGLCIVGDFEDIHNFIESVGYAVDEDNLYHWKEFPWDNAKKLDTVKSSRRPIKSSYNIVGVNVDSNGNLYYKFWNEDKKTFDRDSINCTEYEDEDSAQYELQYRIPSKYDTIFDYFEIHDSNKPYKLQSSRKHKISSSQRGFENVAEGTQYDDYHIDTTGMGILDVEHIISEIEGRGNQAVLTVQTSDGATQHTQFTLDDWKKYKNAVNGVDEFSRNSGTKGAAITDVWVTEVKGGSYVHNSRRPIKSNVFTEGYDAYYNRLEKSDNPYFESDNPIEHQEWERGWKVAEEDYMSELFDAQEEDFEITSSRRPIKSSKNNDKLSLNHFLSMTDLMSNEISDFRNFIDIYYPSYKYKDLPLNTWDDILCEWEMGIGD